MNNQSRVNEILGFLESHEFSTTSSFDEFTGKKHIYIQSTHCIIFSSDFEDVDYRHLQDGMKQFAKQKVDTVCGKITESQRQYMQSSISQCYDEETDRLFNLSKSLSRMEGKLAYIEDSEWNEQFILLNFEFINTSHHRDIKDCKVFCM